jgi:uncharacterized OB-fold protein
MVYVFWRVNITDFSELKMENNFQCNLCKETSIKKIPFKYSFEESYLYGLKCRSCGLISIFPQPTAEEIKQMYSEIISLSPIIKHIIATMIT